MNIVPFSEIIQAVIFIAGLISISPFLGSYLAKLMLGEQNILTPVMRPVEKAIYKIAGIDPLVEMDWKSYTFSILSFSFFGIILLIMLQLAQSILPINPQKLSGVEWWLAFNTAVSFVTNTNWQSYSGETTLSYFVQMIGLTVQNFVSAATGIAVLLAFTRGLTSRHGKSLGNFWVDLVRSTLYVLIPLSLILALLLVSQGVVQSFSSYKEITTLEGYKQIIPLGPAASQVAIKQLGTNGGGFFNANSAFPFENPTPLSNFLEMFSILLLPASLVFTYGKLISSKKQAWIIFFVMLLIFFSGLTISVYSEYATNNIFHTGGLMEGKETRFGILNSVLWSTATTAASNGSVIAIHSSLSPLSGLVAMFNIQLGEIIFGGVGSGLYGMLLFILITVFISGLMIGRTPEYLGKKIDAFEIKWAIVAILLPNTVILLFSSLALTTQTGLSGLSSSGPHGLSEILYAFSSAAGNNGSAFAGLNTNNLFYNLLLSLGMLVGRFGVIIPCLAIAGNLVKKNITPSSKGTLKTDTLLFASLLIGVIFIVGALTFFPALSLGPLLEHLLMNNGVTF